MVRGLGSAAARQSDEPHMATRAKRACGFIGIGYLLLIVFGSASVCSVTIIGDNWLLIDVRRRRGMGICLYDVIQVQTKTTIPSIPLTRIDEGCAGVGSNGNKG
jgi:hypothetical protein